MIILTGISGGIGKNSRGSFQKVQNFRDLQF